MHNDKIPQTPDAQIALLSRRGMHIADKNLALHHLSHIHYHRLSAYWHPMENIFGDGQFRRGASFDEAMAYYVFDGDLRILMMEAIKHIEVSVRTQWVRNLSAGYGAHAHLNAELFADKAVHEKCTEKLREQIKRNRRDVPANDPPVWEAAEAMSFSLLSRWYKNQGEKLRRQTANAYSLDEQFFSTLLHSMAVVRNHCAHHERLWNRALTIPPKQLRKKPKKLVALFNRNPNARRKIYNMLVMTAYLTEAIRPAVRWRNRLADLVCGQKYDVGAPMGFSAGWRESAFWN